VKAARDSRAAGNHDWACFQAQQAGEKALKALWLARGLDPWGHSLAKLIQTFPEPVLAAELTRLLDLAKQLDKLYIPTRYPNGLPDLTPAEVYTAAEADAAIAAADRILAAVGPRLG
jgi:HEPN domain-containing protein